MTDRFLRWLGAGILAAGLLTATMAGAGVALADDGTTSGSDKGVSSETSNSTGKKQDSDKDTTKKDPSAGDEPPAKPSADADQGVAAEPAKDPKPTDEDVPKKKRDHDAAEPAAHKTVDKPTAPDVDTTKAVAKVEAKSDEDEVTKAAEAPAQTEKATAPPTDEAGPIDEAVAAAKAKQPPVVETALAFAAAEPAATPTGKPTLLNVVGTFLWGLFDMVSKAVDFPPVVPAGSTVTAGRSTLQIDCGDGYTADADWYFPTEGEPDKFIYFQHGFPGRAGFYNLTLADLAERNNAIVVAPSLTSNIFACDGCQLTGDQMHAAVAKLFEGDRAALLASARAAGYEGTLPEQFVFSGQSGGGITAAGAARYFEELGPVEERANLVGVLLFDTADGGVLSRALDKIPATVPVLHISGAPAPINLYGEANQVLAAKRPGQFNGVQLVGGVHGDAFRSSVLFGIPQLVVSAALGFSKPENVEAVQVLSEGWLTDMYEHRVYNEATRTGIYGDPGEPGQVLIDIPTDAGVAQGYVLPGPTPRLTFFDLLIRAVINSPTYLRSSPCAVDPSAAVATATTCSASVLS